MSTEFRFNDEVKDVVTRKSRHSSYNSYRPFQHS